MFSIIYRNCPINITYVIDPKLVSSLGPPIVLNKFEFHSFFLQIANVLGLVAIFHLH
jgi:hypothetical protein